MPVQETAQTRQYQQVEQIGPYRLIERGLNHYFEHTLRTLVPALVKTIGTHMKLIGAGAQAVGMEDTLVVHIAPGFVDTLDPYLVLDGPGSSRHDDTILNAEVARLVVAQPDFLA